MHAEHAEALAVLIFITICPAPRSKALRNNLHCYRAREGGCQDGDSFFHFFECIVSLSLFFVSVVAKEAIIIHCTTKYLKLALRSYSFELLQILVYIYTLLSHHIIIYDHQD